MAASDLLASDLIQNKRSALRDLKGLAAERARAESETDTKVRSRLANSEREFQKLRQEIQQRRDTETTTTQQEYQQVRQAISTRFDTEYPETQNAYKTTRQAILDQFESDKTAIQQTLNQAHWEAGAVAEAAREQAEARHKEMGRALEEKLNWLPQIQEETQTLLKKLDQQPPEIEEPTEPPAPPGTDLRPADLLTTLQERIDEAVAQLGQLQRLELPKYTKGNRLLWIVAAFAVIPILLLWRLVNLPAALGGLAGAVVLALLLQVWLKRVSRNQVARRYRPLAFALTEAEALGRLFQERNDAFLQRQKNEIKQKRQRETSQGDETASRQLSEITRRRDRELRDVEVKYPNLLAEIADRRDRELRAADETYPRRLAEIAQRSEVEANRLQQGYQRRKEESQAAREGGWNALAERWNDGMGRAFGVFEEVAREDRRHFPAWNDPVWESWDPPSALPPAIRFGTLTIDRETIPQSLPTDPRLQGPWPARFTLPALLAFPGYSSMLFRVYGTEAKERAVSAIQGVMMRLLTTVPPGKVRFTIVDPIGLGQNFAAFMHLADQDELLVTKRIWTEPQDIEEQLTDLTEHMERVIQKYLRNEFATIEEYNLQAGEVAEPFRFLVIANLPANFTDNALRRLVSIASSGPRCGVFTLISADVKQRLPEDLMHVLDEQSLVLDWRDGRFAWRDEEFGSYPLELEQPPNSDFATRLLRKVGERAKEAGRVEVPFEIIAPPPEKYWDFSTARTFDVPLGRMGANKLQHMLLGRGTAQHVLIAGRTGSGKSTLLHALITNAALRFNPDELELYLIDFKKGVEFKTYAAYELPHARVIAVESEREFGLSVLQRLNELLTIRGDKFRAAGVQDLASYRGTPDAEPMPRVLLVVDEFQEFFVEDDKIAQDVGLLLDRLVRQGRAFGVHIVLGSQSLGGAYSVGRSTLGQMAVRIALQCSESDAHLILSEENSAARLLSRPGEAIYNDASGLPEANQFFQVVFLTEERREDYLRLLHEMAEKQDGFAGRPQIVFEGNIPADVEKNEPLRALLTSPSWPGPVRAASAWLGDAIAIKEPTAAAFRPQSGSNVLMIGQQAEAALGIMSTCLLSLAAQYAPSAAKFYVFDGSPVDFPFAGYFEKLVDVVPHPVQLVGWRDLSAALTEISAEMARRQADEAAEGPAIFLLVYDMHRFRDLRKQEDDYGFGRSDDEPAKPSQQFADLLRDGPQVNIYTLTWCDTLNNLNRTLERQSLREFEMRILFQMSPNDSSTLIDTPVAGRLGPNRALFASEEQGQLEKFRPYSIPPDSWLSWVRDRFLSRQTSGNGGPQSTAEPITEGGTSPTA